MLWLTYHNFEFLLSNLVLGKIELLLPTTVLLPPEIACCPIKCIGFSYKYFWIHVLLQLTTHFGPESFSRKKFNCFQTINYPHLDQFNSIFNYFFSVGLYVDILWVFFLFKHFSCGDFAASK